MTDADNPPIAESEDHADPTKDSCNCDRTKPMELHSDDSAGSFALVLHDLVSKASLDDYVKVAAIGGIVLYILGLLIVNVYLFQIGATDFSLLRTRFILTGTLATLFFAGIAAFVVGVSATIRTVVKAKATWRGDNPHWPIHSGVAIVAVLATIQVVLLSRLLSTEFQLTYRTSIMDALGMNGEFALGLITSLAIMSMSVVIQNLDDPSQAFRSILSVVGTLIMVISVSLMTFVLWIDMFAASIFPLVPEQFGGGRPKEVTIILKDGSTIADIPSSGGETKEGDRLHVQLVWEGEQAYLVKGSSSPDGPYLQIARDQVAAVLLGVAGPAEDTHNQAQASPVAATSSAIPASEATPEK